MDNVISFFDSLRFQDAVFSVIGTGLVSYLVFKRFEPQAPLYLAALLIVVPALLIPVLLPHYSNGFQAIGATYGIYLSTLLTLVVSYRLSPFHPLAKYPGPIICKVTKIWFTGLTFKYGNQHLYYKELHEQYGDVIRIGPNELSFRDPSAIGPMLGTNGMPKGPWWDGRMPKVPGKPRSLLALRDPREHTRRRKPWNRAFTSAALKDYEVIVEKRATQLMDALSDRVGQTVDFAQWIGYFTVDFMNDMVFGGGSELIRDGDKDGLWHLIETAQPDAHVLGHLPWLAPFYSKVPGFGKGLKAFRAYSIQRAKARREQGSITKDLFYHLIDEGGVESVPPTLDEVLSDASPAILAGADTTSTALANIFWLILKHPKVYKRLQVEVDALGSGNVLDTGRHAHMAYLNAVINESLRLFPPVASGSQRAPLIGSGGKAIGPHFIPEGTSSVVHFYSLQRDARNFSPKPDTFIPERWLSPEEQVSLEPAVFKGADVIHNTAAFIPFSFGPANCVGKNLAYQEMRVVICLMMQKFDIRFGEGFQADTWESNLQDYFVILKGKLPLVLTFRNVKN